MVDRCQIRSGAIEGDELFPVCEVGPVPGQCCATEADELKVSVEKDGVGENQI
jgi:hypothetical protein